MDRILLGRWSPNFLIQVGSSHGLIDEGVGRSSRLGSGDELFVIDMLVSTVVGFSLVRPTYVCSNLKVQQEADRVP